MNIIAWITFITSWLSASIYLTGVVTGKSIKDKAKNLVQGCINIITMFFMLYILGFIF